jgi:hypothetical protein
MVLLSLLTALPLHAQRTTITGPPSLRMAKEVVALKSQLARLTPDDESDDKEIAVAMAEDAQHNTLVSLKGSLGGPLTNARGSWSEERSLYWVIDKNRRRFAAFRLTDQVRADAGRIETYLVRHGAQLTPGAVERELDRIHRRRLAMRRGAPVAAPPPLRTCFHGTGRAGLLRLRSQPAPSTALGPPR